MKPDEELMKRLDQQDVSQDLIGNAYCSQMVRRGECPRLRSSDCVACLHRLRPVFEVALQDVDNRTALIIWRLSKLGKGDLSLYEPEPKQKIKSYRQYANPKKELLELFS